MIDNPVEDEIEQCFQQQDHDALAKAFEITTLGSRLADEVRCLRSDTQRIEHREESLIKHNFEGFNKSIRSFSQIDSQIMSSHQTINTFKSDIHAMKDKLTCRMEDMRQMYRAAQKYDLKFRIAKSIQEISCIPETIAQLESQKRFLDVAKLLVETCEKLDHAPQLAQVAGLAEIIRDLRTKRESFHLVLTQEVQAHLYLKAVHRADDDPVWNTHNQATRGTTGSSGHSSGSHGCRPRATWRWGHDTLFDETRADDPNAALVVLVEALDVVHRLPDALETIAQRISVELQKTIDLVLESFHRHATARPEAVPQPRASARQHRHAHHIGHGDRRRRRSDADADAGSGAGAREAQGEESETGSSDAPTTSGSESSSASLSGSSDSSAPSEDDTPHGHGHAHARTHARTHAQPPRAAVAPSPFALLSGRRKRATAGAFPTPSPRQWKQLARLVSMVFGHLAQCLRRHRFLLHYLTQRNTRLLDGSDASRPGGSFVHIPYTLGTVWDAMQDEVQFMLSHVLGSFDAESVQRLFVAAPAEADLQGPPQGDPGVLNPLILPLDTDREEGTSGSPYVSVRLPDPRASRAPSSTPLAATPQRSGDWLRTPMGSATPHPRRALTLSVGGTYSPMLALIAPPPPPSPTGADESPQPPQHESDAREPQSFRSTDRVLFSFDEPGEPPTQRPGFETSSAKCTSVAPKKSAFHEFCSNEALPQSPAPSPARRTHTHGPLATPLPNSGLSQVYTPAPATLSSPFSAITPLPAPGPGSLPSVVPVAGTGTGEERPALCAAVEPTAYNIPCVHRPAVRFHDIATGILRGRSATHGVNRPGRLLQFLDTFIQDVFLDTLRRDAMRHEESIFDDPYAFESTDRSAFSQEHAYIRSALRMADLQADLFVHLKSLPEYSNEMACVMQSGLASFFARVSAKAAELMEGTCSFRALDAAGTDRAKGMANIRELAVSGHVTCNTIALDSPRILALAKIALSLEWMVEKLSFMSDSPTLDPRSSPFGSLRRSLGAQALSRSAISQINRSLACLAGSLAPMKQLAARCWAFVRLEMGAHCLYFLDGLAQNTYVIGEESLDPDKCVVSLNRDLTGANELLSAIVPPERLSEIFGGLDALITSAFMHALKRIKRINSFGIQKLCLDLYAIQQNLTAITRVDEQLFERAREYFKLCLLGNEELLATISEQGAVFTLEEYKTVLMLAKNTGTAGAARAPRQTLLLQLEALEPFRA